MAVANLYVIYDKVAEESGPVFEARNHGTALRGALKSVNEQVDLKEYKLLHIGYINKDTAEITPTNLVEEISWLEGEINVTDI